MKVIVVRTGEISLKTPRIKKEFEKLLFFNIKKTLEREGISCFIEKTKSGRIIVRSNEIEKGLIATSRVFGVVSVSIAEEIHFSSFEELVESCLLKIEKIGKTFAVRAKRAGPLPFTSQELASELGKRILENFPKSKVDLENPETEIFVDFREDKRAYLYFNSLKGAGGIPYGIEGNCVAIIENEDSVIAALEAGKRGCSLSFFAEENFLEKAAEIVGKCIDFLPLEKIIVYPLKEIKEKKVVVSGKKGLSKEKDFLEICPLSFLTEEEINQLKRKYFVRNKFIIKKEKNFVEVGVSK